jgi:hypothetical protein
MTKSVADSNFEKNSGTSIKQHRNVIKRRKKNFTICILTYVRKAIKETTKGHKVGKGEGINKCTFIAKSKGITLKRVQILKM